MLQLKSINEVVLFSLFDEHTNKFKKLNSIICANVCKCECIFSFGCVRTEAGSPIRENKKIEKEIKNVRKCASTMEKYAHTTRQLVNSSTHSFIGFNKF